MKTLSRYEAPKEVITIELCVAFECFIKFHADCIFFCEFLLFYEICQQNLI